MPCTRVSRNLQILGHGPSLSAGSRLFSWSWCQPPGLGARRLVNFPNRPAGSMLELVWWCCLQAFALFFPLRPYRRFWISWLESWMLVVVNLQPLSVVKNSGLKQKWHCIEFKIQHPFETYSSKKNMCDFNRNGNRRKCRDKEKAH